jgi:hypothetical protein
MRKPVIVGDLEFRSKKEAKEFFRTIRNRYSDGTRIAPEDDGHLRSMVAIHPEAETKEGCGIAYFTVETDTRFGRTRHFLIHRTDGSYTDISFHSAIDGRNERKDRLESLRQAVMPQVVDFKNRSFDRGEDMICPLSGRPITPESYHVDHTPPHTFQQLVDGWLKEESLLLTDVAITPPADNQYVTEMINPVQIESWTNYHANRAQLRMLSPIGNLSNAKR